jgi:hypothetical protein
LQTGAAIDLTPSMHWPAPITTREIEHDRGPVLITVEYRIGATIATLFSSRSTHWRANAVAMVHTRGV